METSKTKQERISTYKFYNQMYSPLAEQVNELSAQTRLYIGHEYETAQHYSKKMGSQAAFWYKSSIAAGSREGYYRLAKLYYIHSHDFFNDSSESEIIKKVRKINLKASIRGHVESMIDPAGGNLEIAYFIQAGDFAFAAQRNSSGHMNKLYEEQKDITLTQAAWLSIGLKMYGQEGTKSETLSGPEEELSAIAESCQVTRLEKYCDWAENIKQAIEKHGKYSETWSLDEYKYNKAKEQFLEFRSNLNSEELLKLSKKEKAFFSQITVRP